MNDGLINVSLAESIDLGIEYPYFDGVLNRRTIIFNREIGDDLIERLYIPLRNFELDESQEPVTLLLATPGGSVIDGFFVADIINNYKKPLNIICLGFVYSLGMILLGAGSKNPNVKKYCFPHTTGLIHAGSATIQGEAGAVQDAADFNKLLDKQMKDFFREYTIISDAEMKRKWSKQWFFTSEDLLKYGFVNEVLTDANFPK